MKKFRLPRKIKKSLKGHLWLYPADEKNCRVMASPRRYQKDYSDLKLGIVKDAMNNAESKKKRKEDRKKLDSEIIVSNEELKLFVENVFAEEFRVRSYNTLLRAKINSNTIVAYYNFINAYNLFSAGEDSFGNICCMAVDRAASLLKKNNVK